jgi:flavin-dependent dehydrogenase
LIDIGILGGGPAGTAAALEARRLGLGVAIWEKEHFPRAKVCGEFISAESVLYLEGAIPGVMAGAASMLRAEFVSRSGRVEGFPLPRAARGISRRAMDDALWKAAAHAGAAVHEGATVLRVKSLVGGQESAWAIESTTGAARVKSLVVACGRWWKIEGLESPATAQGKMPPGDWLGAKAHFRGIANRSAVEMYYFPGGYCGLAPVEDGRYNACCLVHRSLAKRAHAGGASDFRAWIGAVARHSALDGRLREGTQDGETVTTAPVRPARRSAVHGEVLFLGDAAGFLDPFTGDGISMALHSGRLAAEELARALKTRPWALQQAALAYDRRLHQSVQRSYAVAAAVRALVRAPEFVQVTMAKLIPFLGGRLHAETRWRHSQSKWGTS